MGGVYNVSVAEDDFSVEEMERWLDDMVESVPKGAPESDFAAPPSGLYVGDAKHAALAVQAVTSGLRGNKAKKASSPGVKSKIAAAIKRFYSGDKQKYYLSWLHSGKKPEKAASEAREMQILGPSWAASLEPSFPVVPTNPRVDLGKLMAAHNDDSPVIVTRPLAILGDVSENGLEYNQAIFEGIYSQVMEKAVPARQGHVSAEGKSSDFPADDGYWIGVVIDDTVFGKPTLFGKCYIVPGDLRKMVLSRQATGTPISNSLYGNVMTADGEPVGVRIETIDFVPEERAALQTLGGDFVITSEMEGDEEDVNEAVEDKDMELSEAALREAIQGLGADELCRMVLEMGHGHKLTAAHLKEAKCDECNTSMREMLSKDQCKEIARKHMSEQATPEETYDMLPGITRKHVAESYLRETKQEVVSEEAKVVDEKKVEEMQTAISEMQSIIKSYQRQDFERALDATVADFFSDWQVRTPAGQQKLDALRKNLRVLTVAEMAGSTRQEDIKAAADKVWPDVQPLAEMTLASLAGPNVQAGVVSAPGAGVNKYGYDAAKGRYDDEFVQRATQATGALGGRSDGGVK